MERVGAGAEGDKEGRVVGAREIEGAEGAAGVLQGGGGGGAVAAPVVVGGEAGIAGVEFEGGIGEDAGDVELAEGGADAAEEEAEFAFAGDDEADDDEAFTGLDAGARGNVDEAGGGRRGRGGRIVEFEERDAGGVGGGAALGGEGADGGMAEEGGVAGGWAARSGQGKRADVGGGDLGVGAEGGGLGGAGARAEKFEGGVAQWVGDAVGAQARATLRIIFSAISSEPGEAPVTSDRTVPPIDGHADFTGSLEGE